MCRCPILRCPRGPLTLQSIAASVFGAGITSSVIFFLGGGGPSSYSTLFFFNDTATTEIYTLSLHDALPISPYRDPCGAPAMLKIWGRASSSNVQKVLWCCAELELPFERVDHGGPFGGNRDPEYLPLNPHGLIPTVIDGGFVLWESNTVCPYPPPTRTPHELQPIDPAAP